MQMAPANTNQNSTNSWTTDQQMYMKRDVHPNILNTKEGELGKEWTNLLPLSEIELLPRWTWPQPQHGVSKELIVHACK